MLGFILTDLMSSGTSLFQKQQNLLLKVDDVELNYQIFEKELEENINIKFFNPNLGRVNISQSQRLSERDLFWEQKVDEIIIDKKLAQSGILVGNLEVWDLISGEITNNQSQLFGYFFREQTESGEWNQYDPSTIKAWIDMSDDNPQWFRYLFFKQSEIKKREVSKYTNAIKKSFYVTESEKKDYYTMQTQSYDGKYVFIPFNSIKSEVDISQDEIKDYYEDNINDFPNSPTRQITYFNFNLDASEDDKQSLLSEMNSLLADRTIFNKRTGSEEIIFGFSNTTELQEFVNEYGDNKYYEEKISNDDLNTLKNKYKSQNNVIGPYLEDNFYKMKRIIFSNRDSITLVSLERAVYASDQTLNQIYSSVNDFINNNSELDSLKALAKSINIRPREVRLAKMDESVPGLGPNRTIVRWAFDDKTNLNEAKYFDLEDKYIVAVLSMISESEHQKFNQVSAKIKQNLINDKKANLIKSQLANKTSDLNIIANQFDTEVKNISQLKFNSNTFGVEGSNPDVVGAFIGSETGVVSSPFISSNGVFVFEKTKESDVTIPSNLDTYNQVILREYEAQVDAGIMDALRSNSNITDNRFNFY